MKEYIGEKSQTDTRTERKAIFRPHICPDKACQIIFSLYDRQNYEKGEGFSCWGKLFKLKESDNKENVDTHSHCVYTPSKGLIRFFINESDAHTDIVGSYEIIKNGKRIIRCQSCGLSNDIIIGMNVKEYNDGSRLCDMCAVRESKVVWKDEENRWKLNR